MKKFHTDWQAESSASAEAIRVLPALLRHWFQHGDHVIQPRTSEKRLHEFRLATKRARYTLELFEPLFGTVIRQHLDGLKKVQQVLGQLNDCQTSLELLKELPTPCDAAWIDAIKLRRDKKRGDFTQMWLDEFADESRRESWLLALI